MPEDAESMSNLSGRSELALPIPEEEGGRPGRRRARRGGGFSILFIGALLVAGTWFGGKYARTWFGAGASANSASPAAGTDHTGAQPTPGVTSADKQATASPDAAAASRGAEAAEAPAPAHRTEPAAAHEAGHETVARRHGGEHTKDFVGRDLAGLKMAPDPSLLPAPAPPVVKNVDTPPPAPPATENP